MVTTDYIGKSALNNSFGALQKKKNNRFQKVMITDFFIFGWTVPLQSCSAIGPEWYI